MMSKGGILMSNPNDKYTPEDYTRFTMRINTALFERIKILAEKEKRSAVKQIEFILEQYFQNIDKE